MKRLAQCVTLAIVGCFGLEGIALAAHAPLIRTETEANDTTATANALPLLGGYGVANGAVNPAADLDFFSFVAPANSKVWILIDTGGTQVGGATSRDTVIELYAPDGTTLIESDDDDGWGTGGDTSAETGLASAIAGRTLPAGGTYFIKVRAFSNTTIVNPYRLNVVVTNSTPLAEAEPNDTVGTANSLAIPPVLGLRSGAIALAGEIDIYSVTLTAGDMLLISADGDPEKDNVGTDLTVNFIAPDGFTNLLAINSSGSGSAGFPPAESAWHLVTTSGTYFLSVSHSSTMGTGTYHIMAGVGAPIETVPDFDGDRKAEVSVYRGSTGDWFISRSIDAVGQQVAWGAPSLGDIPLPGDYDGDRKADIAVFRNSSGQWFLRFSGGGTTNLTWGAPSLGDKPMPADYDGDGRADLAVYRNSTGQWFIRNSGGGTQTIGWGAPSLGDTPVSADYDGDGKADVAVYRTSTGEWYIRSSMPGNALITFGWGSPGLNDIPVPGDYDGDAKTDGAVYRPSTGEWFIRFSSGGSGSANWGAPSLADIPVPQDFDGDGKCDIAVYRGSAGQWFSLNSNGGSTFRNWGAPSLGDIPLNMPAALR